MEDQKPWPGFSRNQDFAKGKGLTLNVKMSELRDALIKLVLLKRITDGNLRAEPQLPEDMKVGEPSHKPLGDFL